ncbi:MAG: hypothetical protein AB7R89_34670 [Dehalococcoidia bacterium]
MAPDLERDAERRTEREQEIRLARAVRDADAAMAVTEATFEEARRELARLARELGFPLASSWRPEEADRDDD